MLAQELSVLLHYCTIAREVPQRLRGTGEEVHYAALPEIKHVLLVLRMRIHRSTDERRSRPLGRYRFRTWVTLLFRKIDAMERNQNDR